MEFRLTKELALMSIHASKRAWPRDRLVAIISCLILCSDNANFSVEHAKLLV